MKLNKDLIRVCRLARELCRETRSDMFVVCSPMGEFKLCSPKHYPDLYDDGWEKICDANFFGVHKEKTW